MFLLLSKLAFAQLSSNHYANTCPKALSTIKSIVHNAVVKEHRMGASLLRLHFHDCFVNARSIAPSLFLFTFNESDLQLQTCMHASTQNA